MQLVIVESPAKAKTLERYLGKDFKVLASYGHIRDLPSKDGSVNPDNGFEMVWGMTTDAKKHVKEIEKALEQTDTLYLATDPDREGEAISWHVLEVLKKKLEKKHIPLHRVVFHEVTKSAVRNAIANPREINSGLVDAYLARRALDYLVGFTLSPILWRKIPGSRSAGRVQSVALRLIVEREREIDQFVSEEYWSLSGDFSTSGNQAFLAKLVAFQGKKLQKLDVKTKSQADEILGALKGESYVVSSVERKDVKKYSAPPFTTSTLQQEAARKLGFSASRTMQTAQRLYEGVDIGNGLVGLISYMRTDSVNLSNEAISSARSEILSQFGKPYLPEKPKHYKNKAKNAQEAHEAIRPTDFSLHPDNIKSYLSSDQIKLYDLIWKRALASQMMESLFDQLTVSLLSKSENGEFRATGRTLKFDGFLKLYREGLDEGEEDGHKISLLPNFQEGEAVKLQDIIPDQHFTQPPPRYSEASLVKKLEELGIGRPSTYASIIQVLQNRKYVKLENKRFYSEDLGKVVSTFLEEYFSKYVEYDFTAKMEDVLDDISHGKTDSHKILKEFWADFKKVCNEVGEQKMGDVIARLDELLARTFFPLDEHGHPDHSCPECKKGVLRLRIGKYGAFFGCDQYPECKHTKKLSSEEEEENVSESSEQVPRILGTSPSSDQPILLKKGPYGFYLQEGGSLEDPKAPFIKRSAIPKGFNAVSISMEKALFFLSLPRVLGDHPEDGEEISMSIGKFGPYVKHGKKFTSVKLDEFMDLGLNGALEVLARPKPKKK